MKKSLSLLIARTLVGVAAGVLTRKIGALLRLMLQARPGRVFFAPLSAADGRAGSCGVGDNLLYNALRFSARSATCG
jgi:hypothetical protein